MIRALSFALILLLSGCSSSGDFKVGLYTKNVKGTIRGVDPSSNLEMFILVMDYHRTLLETSSGYLYRVSSSLVYPDERGNYRVPFSTDTSQLDIRVYAKGYLVESHRFNRTLGVGEYVHDVVMQEDKNWKNTYYLMIKPDLVQHITEPRFQMRERDKLFIGEWLSNADKALE